MWDIMLLTVVIASVPEVTIHLYSCVLIVMYVQVLKLVYSHLDHLFLDVVERVTTHARSEKVCASCTSVLLASLP